MTLQPILCRLGWHRWKPVFRWTDFTCADWQKGARFVGRWMVDASGWLRRYYQLGRKCTRCGKRRSV